MRFIDLPLGIEDQNGQCLVTYEDVHRAFASTVYGRNLAGNIRFKDYKPEDVSPLEWQTLLGFDVNNLRHMRLTFGYTKYFLSFVSKYSLKDLITFSRKEKMVMLLTAVIHDWAEAVTNDKNYNYKTGKDEEDEIEVLSRMIPEIITHTHDAVSEAFEGVIEVLAKRDEKLSQAFNAIEHIGYFRTALRANKLSDGITSFAINPLLKQGLQCLTHSVLGHSIPRLLRYASSYPAVWSFLKNNSGKIVHALHSVPGDMSGNPFRCQTPGHLNENFAQAKVLWTREGGLFQ